MKKNKIFNALKVFCALSFFSFYSVNASFAQKEEEEEKPLIIKVESDPYILRCFSHFGEKVKSHSIAVGDPTGIHYLVDADNGTLLKVWKGEFADIAPMWIQRGGGFFKTPAPMKDLFDAPSFAALKNKNDKWPDSLSADQNYKFKGYKLDKAGRPSFQYLINDLSVDDKIEPTETKDGITRTVSVSGGTGGVYYLLGKGNNIKKSGKNGYKIGDFTVLVDDAGKAKPVIRESKGSKELVVFFVNTAQSKIKYSIIW